MLQGWAPYGSEFKYYDARVGGNLWTALFDGPTITNGTNYRVLPAALDADGPDEDDVRSGTSVSNNVDEEQEEDDVYAGGAGHKIFKLPGHPAAGSPKYWLQRATVHLWPTIGLRPGGARRDGAPYGNKPFRNPKWQGNLADI